MDHPHVQQRGFAAPAAPVPVQQTSQQRSTPVQTISASQQGRESLLSRALRRDVEPDDEGETTSRSAVVLGHALEQPAGGTVPKPILRRASCVESTVFVGRIEERGDQVERDEQSAFHPPSVFQQSSVLQHQHTLNQQQPALARRTSLKFAIAPPPVHGIAPLHAHVPVLEAPHPGSRRSSVDAPGVVGEAEQGDVLAERLIGDIEEDDEDQDEDDEEDQDNEEEEDDEEEDGDYNEDSISVQDSDEDSISVHDGEEQQSEEGEDDRYSSTNWSGYEEDSEAGLSDEELAIKETLIVSPMRRRRVSSRGSADDAEGSTAFSTDRATPATHFSSIASPQHPSFAFARPTNYRRRRPASVVSDGGAGAPVGGSISSLLAVGGSSFVKIDPAERLHRGRGAVQILDPIPQGGRAVRKAGTETDTCTRHCSPPPAKDRSRSSSRSVPPAVSGINHTLRPPRADLSPSAIRMQARRGHGDPRKRKQRDEVAQMNLFGPNGRVARALTTDDDLGDRRLDTTEDELALDARRNLTRGWRSDDALFAVPMIRRYPAAAARYLPPDSGSRKNSLKSLTKFPTTSSATPSDVEHAEPLSDGLLDATHVIRRASDKVGPRRASTCSAPPVNGLLSPTEPTIAYFGASVPCPPAVDDTPALASGTSFCPSTPIDQILHETLAGTPSRRRGSDVASNVVPQVKTTEGSGSDGYRSRASSAMGFRSDDGRVQAHQSVSTTPLHHQQSISYVPVRKGYFEEAAEAPRSLSTTHATPGIQPIKSRPIKCPSPRRRTQDDVRT